MEQKKPGSEVVELTPRAKTITAVNTKLAELLEKHAQALPKNFNETRFLQNFLTVLNDTKEIEKCTPMSIARTAIKGAYLGLDFFRRECYAIVYGDQCNFQTDYKGEIKLAKKYSREPIHDIYAKLVREGDELEVRVEAGKQIVNFIPKEFNDGKILGAFAIVYFKDGAMIYESMSLKEIEEVKERYSKAPNSPAWTKSPGEMYKKVVLRRLCKMIDLDFDYAEQDEAFEEGADVDLKKDQHKSVEVEDPFAKKPGEGAQAEDAQIVDPDAELKATLRKQYPDDTEWQIEERIKNSRVAK